MTAEALFQFLSQMTTEERAACDLFVRMAPKGYSFNIEEVDRVVPDTHSSFGAALPCLVFENAKFFEKDEPAESATENSTRIDTT